MMATTKYGIRFTDQRTGKSFVERYASARQAQKIIELYHGNAHGSEYVEYLGALPSDRRRDTALLKTIKHQHPYRSK